MVKTFKSHIACVLAVSVLAMMAFCCCTVKSVQAAMLKSKACGHCAVDKTAKADKKQSHDCCFAKASKGEAVKVFELASQSLGSAPTFVEAAFRPLFVVKSTLNLAYLDGPPGPLTTVPLYYQSRSIRI